MSDTIQERVARGAKWLDIVELGWAKRINLAKLKMSDCEACIGGQLNDMYQWFMMKHHLDGQAGVNLGFDVPKDEPKKLFLRLTSEWRRAIRERRSE